MTRLPLRVRLVAGFVVAMLVLLTGAAAFVYWRVQFALDRDLNDQLTAATRTISPLVKPSGIVTSVRAADATATGWQVLDAGAAVLDSGGPAPDEAVVSASQLADLHGTLRLEVGDLLPVSRQPYRAQVTSLGDGHYLLVAVRRDHRDEALRELLLQLTLAGLASLAVAAVVGDLLARAALRPVERYRRRAAEIAGGAGGLRLEVPEGRDDEITRLGHTLNDMLAALERSLDHERRFVNDASHELRTPLTLLRSRIQLTRRRPRTVEEHEAVLDELAVDVTRLADLAEQLLALGATAVTGASADLGRVVAGVVERRRLARPVEAGDLATELAAPSPSVAVDPHALERIVTNLVDNAFAHGRPPVVVRTGRLGDRGLVQVEDAGPGMPAALLGTATGRFTRAVEARSRPGAGLGLSLVEQLASVAGGQLRLCHAGTHTVHGHPGGAPCQHGDAMTVSVLLPLA